MAERRLISSGSRFEDEIGYSRAVVDGDHVWVSGTTGYDYAAMTIAEDVVAQADQAFRNIAAALAEAGASLDDVVRVLFIVPRREDFGSPSRVALKFGGQKINLRPHDHPKEDWLAAESCLPGTQDLCFIVAVAVDDIIGQFHSCGVMIELGPVTRQGALGAMGSVYCRDPEGNLIEVSSYSP